MPVLLKLFDVITLRAAAVVPPTTIEELKASMPWPLLAMAVVPAGLMPRKLPWMVTVPLVLPTRI